MDNNLIDLLGKLSNAALNIPTNEQKPTENNGSFLNKNKPEKKQSQIVKPKKTSTDAIIEMINSHNALSRKISTKNSDKP